MELPARWEGVDLSADTAENFQFDGGLSTEGAIWLTSLCGPLRLVHLLGSAPLVGFFEDLVEFGGFLSDLRLIDDTVLLELVDVFLQDAWLGFDLLVHDWLCESWLIELVVTETSVAHEVNADVLAERVAVVGSNLEDPVDEIWFIAIHVDDHRAEHLVDVAWVE